MSTEFVIFKDQLYKSRDGKSMSTTATYIGIPAYPEQPIKDAAIRIEYEHAVYYPYTLYVNDKLINIFEEAADINLRLRDTLGWSEWK